VNIYDEEEAVFIEPMFIVHRAQQKSLSIKISLNGFLKHSLEPCKA